MSNGNAVITAPTSAVDPAVSESIEVYGRLAALRSAIAPDLNDSELQLFAMVAHRMGLDPFAREIHAVKRQGKVTFQVGIDGFRAKAEQTGEYDHQDEPTFGPWIDRPFPHPESASVTIHRWRNGRLVSQSATARWESYYPGESQGFQWKRMPDVMLSKCAEAQAFRKLFPRSFAGVYVPEEMQQAEAAEVARPVGPTHRDRIAAQAAALTTSAAPAPSVADPRPVQADTMLGGASDPATADPSPVAAATGAGEGDADIVEGQAVEVTEAGVTSGEVREWLREQRIPITQAREVAMRLFRLDSIDALTDEQRGRLLVEMDGGARA